MTAPTSKQHHLTVVRPSAMAYYVTAVPEEGAGACVIFQRADWEELGRPDTITVTITAGNTNMTEGFGCE